MFCGSSYEDVSVRKQNLSCVVFVLIGASIFLQSGINSSNARGSKILPKYIRLKKIYVYRKLFYPIKCVSLLHNLFLSHKRSMVRYLLQRAASTESLLLSLLAQLQQQVHQSIQALHFYQIGAISWLNNDIFS